MKKNPQEFVITDHAYQRLKERLKCLEEKIKKVVVKAWHSKIPVGKESILLKESAGWTKAECLASKYRIFQGHIFVFILSQSKDKRFTIKRLITVYKKLPIKYVRSLPPFNNKKSGGVI